MSWLKPEKKPLSGAQNPTLASLRVERNVISILSLAQLEQDYLCVLETSCFVDQIGQNTRYMLGVKYFPKTSVRVKFVPNSMSDVCV